MGKETLKRAATVFESVWDGMNDVARAFVIVVVRRVEALERRLGMNSGNSSLPPSRDHPGEEPAKKPRTSSAPKRGARRGHDKAERTLLPTDQCDRIEQHQPAQCRGCGTPLSGEDPDPRRKQVLDLPPVRAVVTEHQIHTLTCPCCGVRRVLPSGGSELRRGKHSHSVSRIEAPFYQTVPAVTRPTCARSEVLRMRGLDSQQRPERRQFKFPYSNHSPLRKI